ncbi:MAG: hypothetical protein M3Q20_06450 [Actinomycetota bacterium]|nr:hypothetical protein [Actinomycetota bacterium]
MKTAPVDVLRAEVPELAPAQSGWDRTRLLGAGVLGAWAAMFWFLQLSGRLNLYLSTRTAWIVPTGAVILSLGSVGAAATARRRGLATSTRRGVVVAAILIAPIVLMTAAPPATLGSFSSSRKAQFSGRGLWTYWGAFDENSEITFFFVAASKYWEGGANLLGRRAGDEASFVGFAERWDSTPSDELVLTRFVVTCCVADATPISIRVVNVPPGTVEDDSWIEVTGQVYPVGQDVIVVADSIEPAQAPDLPYITP